ncbi:MAG: hypothetical protein K8S25_12190 [Alphaproteobacteria bacterium]|nr:hypothetical protein [Alphaproteobacteria bacterium]
MIRTLIFAAAIAGGWHFETARDPLGQAVYVAATAPDAERSTVALRFLCGGLTGVVLQFNLGDTDLQDGQFSTDEPVSESVRFEFVEGNYDTTAKRAPITDGLATYEIKGSDAAFIAGLMQDSASVSVTRGSASFVFPLDGAPAAIGEVKSACPFKYES